MNNPTTYPNMTPYGSKQLEYTGIQKVRKQILQGVRFYGQATSTFRELPDYLIIGTKRGGTTSLAKWLMLHPEISPLFPKRETRKGMYYLDVNFQKGLPWYKSHFPTKSSHKLRQKIKGKKQLLGDATPYYLYHPHAPTRAKDLVPNAKVIALLRNPIERSFSHWLERKRQNVENLDFMDAIKAEDQRTQGEYQKMINDPNYVSFSHQHFSYIDQSKYSESLKRWMKLYDENNLLILRSEDMYQDPKLIYKQVLDFLELSDFMPTGFSAWNKKQKPEFDKKIKNELSKRFEKDISEVETILGRKMDWL